MVALLGGAALVVEHQLQLLGTEIQLGEIVEQEIARQAAIGGQYEMVLSASSGQPQCASERQLRFELSHSRLSI